MQGYRDGRDYDYGYRGIVEQPGLDEANVFRAGVQGVDAANVTDEDGRRVRLPPSRPRTRTMAAWSMKP